MTQTVRLAPEALATAPRGAGAAAWTFYYYFTARAATD
jgi:hypothetical protein